MLKWTDLDGGERVMRTRLHMHHPSDINTPPTDSVSGGNSSRNSRCSELCRWKGGSLLYLCRSGVYAVHNIGAGGAYMPVRVCLLVPFPFLPFHPSERRERRLSRRILNLRALRY